MQYNIFKQKMRDNILRITEIQDDAALELNTIHVTCIFSQAIQCSLSKQGMTSFIHKVTLTQTPRWMDGIVIYHK